MVMTSNLSAVADFFIRTSDGNLLGRVISVLLALILFGVVFMLRRKIVSLILRIAKKLTAKAPYAAPVIDSFTKAADCAGRLPRGLRRGPNGILGV